MDCDSENRKSFSVFFCYCCCCCCWYVLVLIQFSEEKTKKKYQGGGGPVWMNIVGISHREALINGLKRS